MRVSELEPNTITCWVNLKFCLPFDPKGVTQIIVCFDIDASGIRNVFVVDKTTSQKIKITITNEKWLIKKAVKKMVRDYEMYKAKAEEHKNKVEVRSSLEKYIYNIRNIIREDNIRKYLDSFDKNRIVDVPLNILPVAGC